MEKRGLMSYGGFINITYLLHSFSFSFYVSRHQLSRCKFSDIVIPLHYWPETRIRGHQALAHILPLLVCTGHFLYSSADMKGCSSQDLLAGVLYS